MAFRVLEVTLVSANDLKRVSLFSRPRIYAVASISGFDLRMPCHSTQADQTNGCNPAWNAVAHFPIPAAADTRGLALHVRLRAQRVYLGDRDIGEVFVPIDDLLAGADKGGDPRPVSYQVRRPHSGRAHGVLYFCYKFTDVPAAAACVPEPEGKQGQYAKYVQDSENTTDKTMVPPTVYPPPQAMSSAYPPPQYGSPYAAYPPQPYGSGAARLGELRPPVPGAERLERQHDQQAPTQAPPPVTTPSALSTDDADEEAATFRDIHPLTPGPPMMRPPTRAGSASCPGTPTPTNTPPLRNST